MLKHGEPGPRYEVVARIGQRGCLIQVLNDERGPDSLLVPAPRLPIWDAVHAPAASAAAAAPPRPGGSCAPAGGGARPGRR